VDLRILGLYLALASSETDRVELLLAYLRCELLISIFASVLSVDDQSPLLTTLFLRLESNLKPDIENCLRLSDSNTLGYKRQASKINFFEICTQW
jgi:hypothetical protein